jgi:membrane-bound lytic murein transglycosylase D
LTEENRLLKQQLDEARKQAGANVAPLPAAAAAIGAGHRPPLQPALQPAPSQPVSIAANNPAPNPNPVQAPPANPQSAIGNPQSTDASHPHAYVIQARDSIYSVASRYGLKPSAVLAANPNISPTHLQIGQSLNLP